MPAKHLITPRLALLRAPETALMLAWVCCAGAHAQWMWLDAQGQRVYSDRAPPPDIPLRNVLRQPSARAKPANAAPTPNDAGTTAQTPAAAATGGTATAPLPATAASAPGRDPTLEARKREQDRIEAERKKAEDERRKAEEARAAATRADNCARVRQSMAVLQSGQRMRVPLANGEMGFMSDDQRGAEMQRLQQLLATECRG
ncbi:MAG: DUF4124 domain-containing protein [Burkholderiaceae bacterium]